MGPAAAGWTSVQLLTSAEVEQIRERCQALLAEPITGDKPVAGTRHLRDLAARVPLVASVLGREILLGAVEELFFAPAAVEPEQPQASRGAHTMTQAEYRCPQPGFGAQQLHVDDLPKLDDGPGRGVTAIIALCDFTPTNGSTRVVPGSHRRPDLQRRSGSLPNHPDEQRLVGTAGTAFVFSAHLLHSGTRNESDAERPAIQVTWRTDMSGFG